MLTNKRSVFFIWTIQLNTGLANTQTIKTYRLVPQTTPYLEGFGHNIQRMGKMLFVKFSGLCKCPPDWSSTVIAQIQNWDINVDIVIHTMSIYDASMPPIILTINASGLVYMGGATISTHDFWFYGSDVILV